jgi:hypothetical protein
MDTKKPPARQHAVLTRLNRSELNGLKFLCERESLPAAQVVRRLLIREIRASHQAGETVMVK